MNKIVFIMLCVVSHVALAESTNIFAGGSAAWLANLNGQAALFNAQQGSSNNSNNNDYNHGHDDYGDNAESHYGEDTGYYHDDRCDCDNGE